VFVRTPHLTAALAVFALLGVLLFGGVIYADSVETAYVHALAASPFSHKHQGLALQRVALRQSDLLPVYGSSELLVPDAFRADKIFRLYPTGFNIFTVAGNGDEPLTQAQNIAALGDALRAKRVVISLSPQFFLEARMPDNAYRGNFSPLHAYAFALSHLPSALKQRIAQRMLKYPATLTDPVLYALLQLLAENQPLSPLGYALLYPVSRLNLAILELQDQWGALNLIHNHPEIHPTLERRAQDLNWTMLEEHAAVLARQRASNNPFGIDDTEWDAGWRDLMRKSRDEMTDAEFRRSLERSHTWGDLELLLETLTANDTQALIVTMPWHGGFWNYRGVSAAVRQSYYERLGALAAKYNLPLVTFQEFENDKYFLRDPGSHLSSEGWVRYSQVLDAFFHGRLTLPTHASTQ
jgi:D-alanine transfer protein